VSALLASAAISLLVAIGCAGPRQGPAAAAAPAATFESPLSGMIGAAVRRDAQRVVVSQVGEPAKSAGLEVGDVVVAYNGTPITAVEQFEKLVLGSDPGSRVSVQVMRDGQLRVIDIDVRQIGTASRA
jgi:S1-C subfamily serine protease